jgi:hypothetical protein
MAGATREKLEREHNRVFDALERAARLVGQRDSYILEHDLREEAIMHRLAYYLEGILVEDKVLNLEGFSVDCIYNGGDGYRREHLQIPWPKGTQSQLRKRDMHARPDLIVHQRGTDWACLNLLMVEVRKSSTISQTARKFAYLKCGAFRESGLNYMFAAYICFITGQRLKPHADPWTELRRFPER